MSQLRNRSRSMIAVMAMCLSVLLAGVGCAHVVSGTPQSLLGNRMDRLHHRVEGASSPEARYTAFWSDVCETQRELEAGQPLEAEWRGDELTAHYVDAVIGYYFQLVDDKQLPENALARDGGRFLAGRDVCDFS